MKYRPEIDGLRAISVISVILYHMKINIYGFELFTGGYVGVDLFFLISGYLITKIILLELKKNHKFNLLNFYERRFRRIFPMLFIVILISIPFFHVSLFSFEFLEFSGSITASLFFYSNFYFYFITTEYAAFNSLLKPLLHTWSLGVEEQFYIIFPILSLILFKFCKNFLLTIYIFLGIISFQFSNSLEPLNSSLNFFNPFSRFWEFLLGSTLACLNIIHKFQLNNHKILSNIFPPIGLYLIGYSIMFFDGNTPHPSFITIIPLIGIMLIIFFSSSEDLTGKLLSSNAFVYIGLISYSLYLWHFPILAYIRNNFLEVSVTHKFLSILLTFMLSILSYHFVEKKFRNSNSMSFKKVISSLILLAVTSLLLLNFYKTTYQTEKVSSLLDNEMYRVENKNFEMSFDYSVKKDLRKSILIVGDSHAEDLLEILNSSYLKKDFRINLTSPPKRNTDINYSIDCFYKFLINKQSACFSDFLGIEKQFIDSDYVLLSSHWTLSNIIYIPKVIDELIKLNKKVIVELQTPKSRLFGEKKLNHFDKFLFEKKRLPNSRELEILEKKFYQDFINDRINFKIIGLLKEYKSKKINYVSRSKFMCSEKKETCHLYFPNTNSKVLWDYGHITKKGAEELAKKVDDVSWLSEILYQDNK